MLRPHSTLDDAIPNPNAIAAQNLVRLAVLAGDDAWRTKADRLIEGILSAAERNLFGHVALLNALDLRLRGAEIVATGPDAERFAQAALRAALHRPHRAARRARRRICRRRIRRRKRSPRSTGSAAFVCVGERCSLPVTEPEQIAAAVQAMRSPNPSP